MNHCECVFTQCVAPCPVPKCLHYPPKQNPCLFLGLGIQKLNSALSSFLAWDCWHKWVYTPVSCEPGLCLLPISDLHLQGSACHNPMESHGAALCSTHCHALLHHRQMLTPLRFCECGSCKCSQAFILSSVADAEERGAPGHVATECKFTGLFKLSIPETDPAH